ncbi:hypothetical protein ACOSP7_022141 [Xanthoceras sorbifolium]
MSKFSSHVRFDVEKFNGRINFRLWQVQVKDVLIQSGLHKVLKGKPTPVSSGDSGESKCGQSRHIKKNCQQGGASSTKGSESDTGSVSLLMGDSDFL